ncbi:MAG: 3-coathanger stack domain-containing protein [Bacteroidota bacterium]
MIIRLLLLLKILIFSLQVWAQIPINIVPNYSFEFFSGTFPNTCRRPLDAGSFDVSNWKPGWAPREDDVANNEVNTADWHSFSSDNPFLNCTPCKNDNVNPFDGDKYVFIGKDEAAKHGESFYTELISELQRGKKYKFRIVALGEPLSKFNIHFSKSGEDWYHADLAGENLMNALQFIIPAGSHLAEGCNPKVYEGIIEASKNRQYHIVIHAVGTSYTDHSFVFVDRVELYEYCTEYIIRQARVYRYESELEEGVNIIAGSVVNNTPAMGDVEMKSGSVTTYKASSEVKLVEGFNVERGADFTAMIGRCGSPCSSPNIYVPDQYVICNSQCIVIGSPSGYKMSYEWRALVSGQLQYLSATNVATPIFCPPENGSGTYTYQVIITNQCGESTTKTIYIHYSGGSNPNPDFTITNSNLSSKPDNPSFTINTTENTEYVSVDIIDCNNNILHSTVFNNGIDFTAPQAVNWSFLGFLEPCGCYKIRVRSKNYCFEELKEEVFDWHRIRTATNVAFENFTRCEGGKRKLCFTGLGLARVRIQLFNRNGLKVVDHTESTLTSNPHCIEIPDEDVITNGQYAIIIEFTDCDESVTTMTGFVSVFFCDNDFTNDHGDQWNGDDYNSDAHYVDPESGLVDSLYSTVSPNPVLENSVISYHIPKAGTVKISLMNSNFEQQAILIQENGVQVGDYQIQFSGSDLLNGVNYYMIELYNEQNARHIKRFSVIH